MKFFFIQRVDEPKSLSYVIELFDDVSWVETDVPEITDRKQNSTSTSPWDETALC